MGKIDERLRRLDERAFRMNKRRARLGLVASDDVAWTQHVTRQWRWMIAVASASTLGAMISSLGGFAGFVSLTPAAVGLAFAAGGYRAEELRMRGRPMRDQARRLAAASSALPARESDAASSRASGS